MPREMHVASVVCKYTFHISHSLIVSMNFKCHSKPNLPLLRAGRGRKPEMDILKLSSSHRAAFRRILGNTEDVQYCDSTCEQCRF
jgi:hypothetical protein